MFRQDKKQLINEGRAIGGSMFNYGGFPRIKNLAEENINEEELRSDISPEHKAWYLKSLELGKELKAATKSGDKAKIAAARKALSAHGEKRPMRKEAHPHKSDYGTYHPSTNIDSSREGT
jgi:hypothetical protein